MPSRRPHAYEPPPAIFRGNRAAAAFAS
jgi:hypothetical protein